MTRYPFKSWWLYVLAAGMVAVAAIQVGRAVWALF